jgi:hypothetical protein
MRSVWRMLSVSIQLNQGEAMRKQFNPETTRRVFILEKDPVRGWELTCYDTALIARIVMRLPYWLCRVHVESARIGTNTTDYVKLSF